MDIQEKMVEFDKYCESCEYFKKDDTKGEEPCCTCLGETFNANSKKPMYYKKKEETQTKKKKEEKER